MIEDPVSDSTLARLTGVASVNALPERDEDTWKLLDRKKDRYAADGTLTEEGGPRSWRTNLERIFVHDPYYEGKIKLNEMSGAVEYAGEPLTDVLVSRISNDICYRYGLEMSLQSVSDQLKLVASAHPHHPLREYLQGLQWDGVPRLPQWMQHYLGAEDNAFTRAIGTKWAISAVARAMPHREVTPEGVVVGGPGCKVDNILVLKGAQGARKSSAFQVLGGVWFDDPDIDLGSKDSLMQIHGVWLLEWAELDALRGREATQVKSFITRRVDRYRPPYGQHLVTQPRQSIFVGTTNEETFLQDPTGSRRFWPIEVGAIDLEGLRAVRDQIWAEAVARYQRGESWWLDETEQRLREQASEKFANVDPWDEKIRTYCNSRQEGVLVEDLLDELGIDTKDQHVGHQRRACGVLKRMGWTKKRATVAVNGRRPYVWSPGEEAPESAPAPAPTPASPELPLGEGSRQGDTSERAPEPKTQAQATYGNFALPPAPPVEAEDSVSVVCALPQPLQELQGNPGAPMTARRAQALLEWLEELLMHSTIEVAAESLDWTISEVQDAYHSLRGYDHYIGSSTGMGK